MTLSLHWPCRTALLGAVLGCAALPALSATLSVSVMGQNGRGVQDAVLLLELLALALLADPTLDPQAAAHAYVDAAKGVADAETALEGARQILVERFAEDAALLATLREDVWREGSLCARVAEGKEGVGAKFRDYFDYDEPLGQIPSHRALALFRGRNEDVLTLTLKLGADEEARHVACEATIARHCGVSDQGRPVPLSPIHLFRTAIMLDLSPSRTRRALMSCALLSAAAFIHPTLHAQQVFKVTAIPDESPTELARKAVPLVKYLEAKLGRRWSSHP